MIACKCHHVGNYRIIRVVTEISPVDGSAYSTSIDAVAPCRDLKDTWFVFTQILKQDNVFGKLIGLPCLNLLR